jgi:hypothetical protein
MRLGLKDVCKFLTGAFFVSTIVFYYLFLTQTSVPIIGTNFVEHPTLSGARAVANLFFFMISLYFGFLRK